MIRQIIIPTSNAYTLELPDELIGKQVEVLAFEVENETYALTFGNKATSAANSKASDIFKDCRVDLTNYKSGRDAANTYE